MLRRPRFVFALAACAALAAPLAHAEWLQPDPSYREAQADLRYAVRDTAGHPGDAGALDSVGVALLRLGRIDEASRVFDRVAAIAPNDPTARAMRGKLALFADQPARADSLLSGLESSDVPVADDLFAARLRLGHWQAAADIAPLANVEGRRDLLEKLAERAPYEVTAGPDRVVLPFAKFYPVALVRVKLNGELVLMAVDTGASDLIVDDMAFRRLKVTPVAGQSVVFWTGSRAVTRNAIVQRLDLGAFRVENCPAGVMNLGKWSLEVNPQGERVAGVIGLNLLRKFSPTLDYHAMRLELRRPGTAFTPKDGAAHVPYQLWGENELTVSGSIAGGRKMAMVVQTGVPGCGIAAPQVVFDEFGIKPGALARLTSSAGQVLQGRAWAAVMVSAVSVGAVARDKVQGWSGALDESEVLRHGVRRDALLSNDFFKDRRVTFDWERHELIIED